MNNVTQNNFEQPFDIESFNAITEQISNDVEQLTVIIDDQMSNAKQILKDEMIRRESELVDVLKSDELLSELIKKNCSEGDNSLLIKTVKKYCESLTSIGVKVGIVAIDFAKKYSINDEKIIKLITIETAKIAAAEDGYKTSEFINTWGITDEKALIEIAIIAAKENCQGLSTNIKNYGITDQKALKEIAMIAASHDGRVLSCLIENFGIIDPMDRLSIFLEAYKNYPAMILFHERTHFYIGFKFNAFWKSNPKELVKNIESLFKIKEDELSKLSLVVNNLLIDIEKLSQDNDLVKQELFDWLKFTISCIYLHRNTITLYQLEFLRFIVQYRDLTMRNTLSLALCEMSSKQLESLYAIVGDNKADYVLLPSILLAKLLPQKWENLLEKIQHKNFKDYTYHHPLLSTLNQLVAVSCITSEDIYFLLDKSIDIKNMKKTLQNLRMIEGIILLNESKHLRKEKLETIKDLSDIYLKIFKKSIPLKQNIENFDEKFINTFFSFRSNANLVVYAGKLKSHQEKNRALEILADYVESVLNGNFKEKRYENNEHLKIVFDKREELKKAWKEGATESLDFISNSEEIKIDFQKIFSDKIIQFNHLDEEAFPVIYQYLKSSKEERVLIKDKLGQNIVSSKKAQELLIDQKSKEELKKGSINIKSLQLQNEIIRLIDGETKELEILKNIQSLLGGLGKKYELQNDVKVLIESFGKKEEFKKLILVDTDDPWDLFQCGTEVGSCQRVDGYSKINIGLLAYLMDGKHRLIAIKDETGKIVCRRILRILWDKYKNKPVLFMEGIYPAVISNTLMSQLDRFVIKRAKALDLPLYERGDFGYNTLISLGSPILYEYVDSAGGLRYRGMYEIERAAHVK